MSPPPARIYLDSNIIIYIVEGHPTQLAILELLVGARDAGRIACVTSELTIAEVLVKPFADPDVRYRNEYEALFHERSRLGLLPISRRVLEFSAELRAITGGKLADGIHVATAQLSGCSHFLSEDIRIKLPEGLARLTLSALAPLVQPPQESP